jgi:NAD-dependent SIR2 family protein deacetylase
MSAGRQAFDDVTEAKLDTFAAWVGGAGTVVWFTGAGISTESGLSDYRGPDGIWTRQDQGLPPPVPSKRLSEIRPNNAHHAITRFEKIGKCSFLISQNVDNLHLESGFPFGKLAELHGNKERLRCKACQQTWSIADLVAMPRRKKKRRNPTESYECPDCGGTLGSSIVNFGDILPRSDLNAAYKWVELADLLIVVGSTCQVTPASDLPVVANSHGAKVVVMNIGPTDVDQIAALRFDHEKVGRLLPALLSKVLSTQSN